MSFDRRLPSLLAGAVIISLFLSGCSFVGDAGQVWGVLESDSAHKKALALVVDEVESIDGVESVSSNYVADGPSGDEAELHVIASTTISEQQLSAIAAALQDGFAGVDLENAVPEFTLKFGDAERTGVFTQSGVLLSAEEFVREVVYWQSVEAAAETGLSLTLSPNGQDAIYQRTFETPKKADPIRTSKLFISHFEAVAEVPDESSSFTIWSLAGIWANPSLPSPEIVAVLDDIQKFIPVMDRVTPTDDVQTEEYVSPEGALLQSLRTGDDGVTRAEILIVQREFRAADWQAVVEAAALAVQVPEINFRYIAGDRAFQITTCEQSADQTADDQKLLEGVLGLDEQGRDAAKAGVCSFEV